MLQAIVRNFVEFLEISLSLFSQFFSKTRKNCGTKIKLFSKKWQIFTTKKIHWFKIKPSSSWGIPQNKGPKIRW
jgi:hypothetical protein